MAKWKCDICGNEFDNFHAQGFSGKIYCPLCYFKEESERLKKRNEVLQQRIDNAIEFIKEYSMMDSLDIAELLSILQNEEVKDNE